MSAALRRRLRRLEEHTGTGEAVWVFIEVTDDETRTGDEIMAAMGWDVHPSMRGRPRIYYLMRHRLPGAPPRLPGEPDDGLS